MPAPLSVDLRKRIVESYLDGEGTYAQTAARFRVSTASVTRCLALARCQESLEPLPHSGGKSTQKVFEVHEEAIRGWLQEQPDLKLEELEQLLLTHYGVEISPSQISRVVNHKLGLTRKKSP
jgi:transposase